MCYKTACLGVTESDWRQLGIEALKAMNFNMARNSFVRIRALNFIELTDKTERQHTSMSTTERSNLSKILPGKIYCLLGKYKEAS